ncbi:MAG: redoxin domain-containing protein [Desulfosarcina sp.]|nr:redoxin domain-containing protein [Desulfobacterales bacterium]
MELEALGEAAGKFAEVGANLVLISPQLVEHNRFIREQQKLPFEILSDPGNAVAARYGLRFQLPDDLKALYQKFGIDLEKYNGDDSWSLPMASRLIVDPEGIVRHTAINADYTVRPDPEETLEALKPLF